MAYSVPDDRPRRVTAVLLGSCHERKGQSAPAISGVPDRATAHGGHPIGSGWRDVIRAVQALRVVALVHSGVVPAGLDGNPNPVVSSERTGVLSLVATAVSGAARSGRALIAVDGASGTGKSTFADELTLMLERADKIVVRASIDSFHRPRDERYRLGPDSAEGYYQDSHDIEGLKVHLLEPFTAGTGSYRRALFDEPSDRPVNEPPEPVPTAAILIFDGLFLHRPELVDFWDLSVFLTAATRREAAWQEYLTRGLPVDPGERDVETAARVQRARRHRYLKGQALYEREASPRQRATVVIDNDDLTCPRVIAHRGATDE